MCAKNTVRKTELKNADGFFINIFLCSYNVFFFLRGRSVLWYSNLINSVNVGNAAFSTMDYKHKKSSAIKVGRKMYMSFVTSLSTLVLIAMFNK